MHIGIIGLGKMGMQIARRLHKKDHLVVAWNRSIEPRAQFKKFGGLVVDTVPALVERLPNPRIIWVMLPAGETTEEILLGKYGLISLLVKGDIVIDGGNSFYEDSARRSKLLAKKGIYFFDSGTSGGIHGEKHGFALMVGGPRNIWSRVKPVFRDLAAAVPSKVSAKEGGSYGLVGEAGAGHFVKMVHNGIEYGMMEALAEGYAVINTWNPKIDLVTVTKIWQQGSVIRSWLVDLARDIFEKENLNNVVGYVKHTGEGEWTVQTAKRLGVDVRVIKDALQVRKESEQRANQKLFRNKLLALLRNRFGGHEVKYRK